MGKITDCIKDELLRVKAEEKLAAAKVLLSQGVVVFGESHVEPVARAIVWDLIAAGLVERMFTEQPNSTLGNGQTMEQNLQTLATPTVDGTAVKYAIEGQSEGTMSAAVEFAYAMLERQNELNGRPVPVITYRDLMQHAVRHGVLVFCYDVSVDPTRDRGRKRYPPLSDEAVLKVRNEHMTNRYLTTDMKSFAGTVLLGGSDHFDYAKSKQANMLDLMKIDKSKYIEC